MGVDLRGLLVADLALAMPMTMSPLAYYTAIGIAILVALAVVVWVVRAIAVMPALPPDVHDPRRKEP